VWPSQQVLDAAQQRSRLLHELSGVDGVEVIDWGDTDSERPQEVVEVLVAVLPASIAAVASLVTAWITRDRRSRRGEAHPTDTVEGVRLTAADGTVIELLGRESVSAADRRTIVQAFVEKYL
jgi:hypothetical protein